MFELSDTLSLSHLRYNEDLAKLSGKVVPEKTETTPLKPMKLPAWWEHFHLSETAVYIIVIAVAVAVLLFLIYRMGWLGLGGRGKSTSTSNFVMDETALDTDIYAHDIEGETQVAVQTEDYRTLVQLCYLRALRALCDAEMLSWQPSSTPSEYLRVLEVLGESSSALFDPLRQLTQSYLYTFYGHYPATAEMVADCTTWSETLVQRCERKGGER